MKREQLLGHSMVKDIVALCPYGFDAPIQDTQIMQILRLIYNDENYHRRGDVAAYLSEKTSPEIRQFIYDNILNNNVSVPSNLDLDDATLKEFTRDNLESIYDYRTRLASSLEKYASDYQSAKQTFEQSKD